MSAKRRQGRDDAFADNNGSSYAPEVTDAAIFGSIEAVDLRVVGRQYRLTLGRKEYFIDLLFYHRFLKALVAIELKIGAFEPEFAGKMDFYLNLLNEKERAPDDAPSIGIILCAEKDNLEVEFALKSKSNPIGVAEYHLQGRLPAEMKGKLPSPRQLQEVVRASYPGLASRDRSSR